MRKHLNTIYVTHDEAYVRKDGANLVVEVDGAERLRAPVHLVGGLVAFGQARLSPAVLGFCAESGVTVTHLTDTGRFLARVEGPVSGNVLLRREQYRRAGDEQAAAALGRAFAAAKIVNQRTVLRRAVRDHGGTLEPAALGALSEAERRMSDAARRAELAGSVETLRGIEGEAGAVYFSVFDHFVRTADPDLRFRGRSRRPPLDRLNALLSFAYTLLAHDCRAALETVGLDPAMGFLHALRPGRPALALDLMEEFRSPLADRLVLSLVNLKVIGVADFRAMDNGAVLLTEAARKSVLKAWAERKRDALIHPFLEEETTIGLLPQVQAQLLARHLRGDLAAYPPMFWR